MAWGWIITGIIVVLIIFILIIRKVNSRGNDDGDDGEGKSLFRRIIDACCSHG